MALLKLRPAGKDYLWGGDQLKKNFNKEWEGDILAESWELSCHPDGESIVAEGESAGMTLREYINWQGKRVLGRNTIQFGQFPVLVKFIDARDNLSIQVHPSDSYAMDREGQYGKTEMWYVAECEDDAFLYYGFSREIDIAEFKKRIEEDTLLEVLNRVPVSKGDVFFIEAGTIHAIGKGIVIAEIQQNSNVTYRVYDYGRVGSDGKKRDLHIEKALEVTNRSPKLRRDSFDPHLGVCQYFSVDKLVLDGQRMQKMTGKVDDSSFLHILVLEGNGTIQNGEEQLEFQKGDSLFLAADSGDFAVYGRCEALLTSIPSPLS